MTTLRRSFVSELHALITNGLDEETLQGRRIAAILGDVPSTYAKSPRLWNAAFHALGLKAAYVPLDVPRDRLSALVELLKRSEEFLGGSVTVPYKAAIMPLLDAVDPLTARIGAVNVIVRTEEGRLIGHNTDGIGGLRSLTEVVPDLRGARVLLIGAGGAAQALAVHLWDRMSRGAMWVANRTRAHAEALVQRLGQMRDGPLRVVGLDEMPKHVSTITLVVNASLIGQGGIRELPDGRRICLEPYSALGPVPFPAHPASRNEVLRNHAISLDVCAALPGTVVCYDIIYSPLETMLLRHARWSGHRTLNGKAMNVGQAVEALSSYVCCEWLKQSGWDLAEARRTVVNAMEGAWAP